MYLRIVLLLAFFAATASCKKESAASPNKDASVALAGQWELRLISGGIAGDMAYPAGNGNIRLFHADSTFAFTNQGIVVLSGTYRLMAAVQSGNRLLELHYLNGNQPVVSTDSVNLQQDKLIYLPAAPCCDIPATTYIRLP